MEFRPVPFVDHAFLALPLFRRTKQRKVRQVAMIFAMFCTVSALYLIAGPVLPGDCDSKGSFPEIGYLLFGVAVSLPLALGLAWLTRPSLGSSRA
jgi:hypothetical protein